MTTEQINAMGLYGPTGQARHIQMDDDTLFILKESHLEANADIARLRGALERIACYDDTGGNAALESRGGYGAFDEPGSVEIARAALAPTAPTAAKGNQ